MKKKRMIYSLVIALIIAIASFIAVIAIESIILSGYEKKEVVVAKKDILAKTSISQENINEYFEIVEVPIDMIQENSITSLEEVGEYIIKCDMQKKEQLTINKALNISSDIIGKYKEPVEVSLMVDKLSDAVAGTLCKGNRVDIVAKSEDKDGIAVVLENVYISGAYDSNGTEVYANAEISSIVFNFIIEKEDYLTFLSGVALGDVQLVKVSDID